MAEEIDSDLIATINAMTADRGWIINSYAQIEFLLADLIEKTSGFEEYAEWANKPLPFGIGNRVKHVTTLCQSGRLAPHAEALARIIADLLSIEESRHLYIHGFASFMFTPKGDRAMHFRRYVPPEKGGTATLTSELKRGVDLAKEREQATAFAQYAVGIFREIYRDLGLEPDADVQPATEV